MFDIGKSRFLSPQALEKLNYMRRKNNLLVIYMWWGPPQGYTWDPLYLTIGALRPLE